MKKIILVVLFLMVELFAPKTTRAQGMVYFSNLSQPSGDSAAIGADSWFAQAFNPHASGYAGAFTLDSIQLLMTSPTGNPSGFAVSIYSDSSSQPRLPAVFLGDLNGEYPASPGIYTYTADDITLLTGHNYFIVVTAATPLADGAYNWSLADTASSEGEWPLFNYFFTSTDGSTWSGPHSFQYPFQFAINATPVPEPGVLGLFILCGLGLLWHRRKQRHATT
jgi:hypothetical protein